MNFASRNVWDLATYALPADAASSATQFRWRQRSNSGPSFDHWGIDDVLVEGVANVKIDVGSTLRLVPVEQAELTFAMPIDASSLSLNNVKLTRNGASIPLPSTAVIQQKSSTRFTISGLANANRDAGLYRLELDSKGIVAADGESLVGKSSATWTIDLTPPRAVDVIDVSPDPRWRRRNQ